MKNSKQIKNLIILTVAIMILAIVGLVIFLLNVNVEKDSPMTATENNTNIVEDNTNNYTDISADKSVTGTESEDTTYDIIECDLNGNFQVVLSKNKLYLNVINKENFKKTYPDSKINVNESNEIKSNNFEIKDIKVGKLKNSTYLVTYTNNGEINFLDLNQAIVDNKLELNGELIKLDYKESKMQNVVKKHRDIEEETIILCATNGTNYDLSSFLEL